jgi:hypothetical protein
MEIYLDRTEAVKRMKKRGKNFVSWTLKDITCKWEYIHGSETRNHDGSLAPNPDRESVLQLIIIREDYSPRFVNYW